MAVNCNCIATADGSWCISWCFSVVEYERCSSCSNNPRLKPRLISVVRFTTSTRRHLHCWFQFPGQLIFTSGLLRMVWLLMHSNQMQSCLVHLKDSSPFQAPSTDIASMPIPLSGGGVKILGDTFNADLNIGSHTNAVSKSNFYPIHFPSVLRLYIHLHQ